MAVTIPDDCRKNRPVLENLDERLSALENMTVIIEGKQRMTGKLNVQGGACVLVIEGDKEVGTL